MRCQLIIVFTVVLSISAQLSQLDITMKALTHSPIDEHSVFDFTKLKFRKFNRTTQVVKGEFEILVDHDNNISLSADVYKKQGNEWRMTPFRVLWTPYCDYWKNEKFISNLVVAHTQLPPKSSCPALPKGKYTVSSLPVSGVQVPAFITGEFKVTVKHKYQDRIASEITCELEFERFGDIP